jgi:nucleotide-binding universal stress UspA family protein
MLQHGRAEVPLRALLAVDPYTDADGLLARALPWLERLDAVADLLFVDSSLDALHLYGLPDDQLAVLGAEDRRRVAQLAERLPPDRRGLALVEHGPVEERVAAHADDHDTILVGTRSRTGLAHLWLGSVAERIVRTCPAPVLVVKRPPGPPSEALRVLVAVDAHSELARPTLEAAARWLGARPATIDTLFVEEPALPVVATADPAVAALLAESSRALRDEALRKLGVWRSEVFGSSVAGESLFEIGPPAPAIAATGDAYDLLVLGTHGRRGIGRLFGSVAERVVRLAGTAVLVVHPA